ncbi:MAG: helix-turn-helix domain-containing protein [Candidatus Paceibacterota bacterium]
MGRIGLNEDDKMKSVSKKLYVKYMVSLRCKTIVKSELENLDLSYRISPHGALEFSEDISSDQYDILNKALRKSGMVLLNDSESMLIDKIITTIVEVIHYSDALPKLNFSDLINEHAIVGDESILKIFSDVKGMSVLQFIILQKIERIKELLLYDDMPLPEIAELLNYKNKNYLIAQFKNSTGLTPTYFKRIKKERMAIAKKSSKPVQKTG